MDWLSSRLQLCAYFLLAVLLQEYCLTAHHHSSRASIPTDVEGVVDVSAFRRDGSVDSVPSIVPSVNTQGLAHSRALKQRNDDQQDDDEFECGLSSSERRRYFDDSTQQWLVTDQVIRELNNDVQAIVNCTSENDVVVFQSTRVIRAATTITLPWNLTLRADSSIACTCPRRGPLIVTRTPSITLENLEIVDCNSTSSVIALSPRCGRRRRQGISQLIHLTFQDNEVLEQGHIIESSGRCSELDITDLVFRQNRCIGTHCVILGARNTLTDIYLANNRGSNDTSLDSSFFFASTGSQTTAINVTSTNNIIRSFYTTNGDLRMTNSHFDGNMRHQTSQRRNNSIGGSILFANHSSVSISSTIFEHNSASNGGAVFSWSSNITIEDCIFRENDALRGNGGAIYGHHNSSFDISSSVFSKNHGHQGAAVFSNHTVLVNLINTSIWENNSTRSGAIWIYNGTVQIRTSEFIQNTASRGAGALGTSSVQLTLRNSTFIENTANFGGACIFESNCTVKGSNLLFTNNTAREDDGGGVYFYFSGSMQIRDSVFQQNHAESDGGGIYSEGECRTTLRRTEFLNNTSNEFAGGFQLWRGNFSGSDLRFIGNEAVTSGGAVSFFDAHTVSVSRSRFEENRAESAGAVQFYSTISGSLDRCTFNRNSAPDTGGGGLYISSSNLNISSSVLRSNSGYSGGALYFAERSNSTISDSRFLENSVKRVGGGISALSDSVLSFTNTSFQRNRGLQGGALFVVSGSSVAGIGLECVENHATYGGCLYASEVAVGRFSETQFLNNTAEDGGAAINSEYSFQLFISNSTFKGNHGGTIGGGLLVSYNSSLESSDVTFVDNHAMWGGAFYLLYSCIATISNSSFIENSATNGGGAIGIEENSTMSLTTSTFSGNKAGYGGGVSILSNSTAKVLSSNFTINNASTSGGGVYLQSSNAFLSNLQLTLNDAVSGGSLGAINASLEMVDSIMTRNHAQETGGGVYIVASNASIESTLLELNNAENNGGGISVVNGSSLLCQSCLLVNNRAFSGAGLYSFSNNSVTVVAQLQDSRFENNTADSYGGGIEFASPQNRSINCNNPQMTCGHIIVLNTSFEGNYANHSGAVVLTTDPDLILVNCKDGRRSQDFVSARDMNSLEVLNPKHMCASWKRNKVSSKAYGDIVGTYGQEIVLTIDPEDEVKLVGNTRTGYVLENVSSGRQLPTINVTILDGYGVGPAPTLPHSFEARLSSPDGLFTGLYPTTIAAGVGNFSRVIGLVIPGTYTLEFAFDNEPFETFNVTVIVRGCEVGEEPTTDGLTCQECDAYSYNFNASQVGGCKECPGEATCRGKYIVPKDAHWHKSPCHDTIQECLIEEACTYEGRDDALLNFTQNSTDCNINDTTMDSYNDELCNEGYKGPLCGSCKKSFGLSVRYLCLKCASTFLSLLTIVGIALYLLGASSLTIRGCLPSKLQMQYYQPAPSQSGNPSEPSNGHGEINVEMVKMIVEGHVPREYFQKKQEASTSQITETQSNQQETEHELTKWKITEIFKITLNFLQTIAVAATISVKWTGGMLALFETSEYVGAMSTVALSRPVDCITSSSSAVVRAIWRMLVSLFIPSIVVGVLVSIWGYIAVKEKKGWSYFWKRFALSAIAVTYISYLGLTKMAVRAFYCVSIYNSSSSSSNTKERFWAVDTAIKCYGKDHSGIIGIAAVVIFVITVCFPLTSAIILSRNQESHKKRDSWVFETAGFLFRVFKERLVFWESVVMFRKACLSVIVVFAYPLGGDIQGLLASVLLLFCLYLQLTLRPYRKEFKSLNQLESVSLLVSAVTFNLGLFFINDRCSEFVRTLLATVIVLGNSLFFMFLVFSFSCSSISHLRVALRCENVPITDQAPWWRVIKVYASSRSFSGVSLPKIRT